MLRRQFHTTRCRTGLPLALCASVLLFCAPHQLVKPGAPPASPYGNTNLAIWSNLTDFEIMALGGAAKARCGDPDALFALALFASGDVRSMETYAAYHKRVLDFIEEVRLDVGKDSIDFNRGKVLYDNMFLKFFGHQPGSDELKGYDFSQSKLSEIFRSATYNCISSTLLYVVLARYFDLDVDVAVIPSHVFVQQNLREGGMIEIETTSKNGYNFKNDRSSFGRLQRDWFKARGLVMPTYEDYTKRQIFSPLHVIVNNMINQHTDPARMANVDRYRLFEAMGFCCPEIKAYAYSRLVALNNEVMELQNAKDFESMGRFYGKMLPVIQALDSVGRNDTAFCCLTSSLRLSYGFTIFKTTGSAASEDTIAAVAEHLFAAMPDYKILVNNTCAILQQIIDKKIKEDRFEESAAIADRFCRYPDIKPSMTYLESFVYGNWASSLWPKKDWDTVIRLLRKAISLADKDEVRKPFIFNIKGAYFNWAVQRYNEKNLTESLILLKTCEADFGLDSDALALKNKIVTAAAR